MARWIRQQDPFPAPLREFREQEWPPAEGECLRVYACRGLGYEVECVPRPGQWCGQPSYAMLAEKDPEAIPRWQRADAFERFKTARLTWLGEDHPDYLDEFLGGFRRGEGIRHGRRVRGG